MRRSRKPFGLYKVTRVRIPPPPPAECERASIGSPGGGSFWYPTRLRKGGAASRYDAAPRACWGRASPLMCQAKCYPIARAGSPFIHKDVTMAARRIRKDPEGDPDRGANRIKAQQGTNEQRVNEAQHIHGNDGDADEPDAQQQTILCAPMSSKSIRFPWISDLQKARPNHVMCLEQKTVRDDRNNDQHEWKRPNVYDEH